MTNAAALRAADRDAAALVRARRVDEAVALYDRMLAVAPDQTWVLLQQGAALLVGHDNDRALRHFEALTQRFPRLEDAWHGLGKALYDRHDCRGAIAAFSQAAGISAAPARALYHRGMAHLLAGDFTAGWRDYEHRLTVPSLRPRHFDRPRWDGQPLAGRRLLVVCEQGYGDVFQFIRYLPLLRDLGGRIVFECPAELRALLAPVLDGIEVVPIRGLHAPDTPFDCYAALLSLPHLLGTTMERIPCPGAYLHAPGGSPQAGRRVGVCWAGNPNHPQDLHRSLAPEHFAPLARLAGVSLHRLQKESSHWPPLAGLDGFLHPPPEPLTDFMATARAIMALDLVISVDTSVAHLAGALGKPVWLLLSRAGEWRWLLDRPDSPWYPTMRIFRQSALGAWGEPIEAMARELAGFPAR